MKTHELKCWTGFFHDIAIGSKTWEIRKDAGRDFEVGDELFLSEWDPNATGPGGRVGWFTGRALRAFVSYVSDVEEVPGLCESVAGYEDGISPFSGNWVVLGLANVAPARRAP